MIEVDLGDFATAALAGDHRAIAALLSAIESGATAPDLPAAGARVIGLTGPPGVGKSTLVAALVRAYRAKDQRVAVLAVDPSSHRSGGAFLGDRIRMTEVADGSTYVRSVAARGHLGGLNARAQAMIDTLARLPFDVVLVETVGVGQSEIEIAKYADTVVVVLAPGAGDHIQAVKAGVLEIAEVYVINKADGDGVDRLRRELRSARPDVPSVATIATTGVGVDNLVDVLGEIRT